MSVYHVALPGRVQRYSPIYYPDSHANSAIVPTGLRLTERPPCHARLCVCVSSFSYTHTYTDRQTFTVPRTHAHTLLRVDTRFVIPTGLSPHSRPAWQGFQGALHPRYTVLYDLARQEKITLRRRHAELGAAFDRNEGPRARAF